MAQELGYVARQEKGGFKVTINLLSLRSKIEIVPNANKENDRQPDFRIFTENRVEIGGGWNKVGRTSGNPYVSLAFAHPEISKGRFYANLGRANAQDDEDVFAILWNPEN